MENVISSFLPYTEFLNLGLTLFSFFEGESGFWGNFKEISIIKGCSGERARCSSKWLRF